MSILRVGDQLYSGGFKSVDGAIVVTINEQSVTLEKIGDGVYRTMLNGRQTLVAVAKQRDRLVVDIDSYLLEVFESDSLGGRRDDQHGANDKVFAPMPGKVVKVLVAVGDQVTLRQHLVLVEAMKMENPVVAPSAGEIKAIHVTVGEQVDTEKVLIELEIPSAG